MKDIKQIYLNGFTLIEVVVVLVILGILSAVAIPMTTGGKPKLQARADSIMNYIVYAQSRSMHTDGQWGIRFEGNSFWMFNNGDIDSEVILPGEKEEKVGLQNLSTDSATVSFDDWGVPFDNAEGTADARLESGKQIDLNMDGEQKTIFIAPDTGFVTCQ